MKRYTSRLLRYGSRGIMLSHWPLDKSLFSFNRMILLHGPPGTGKSSLCKALAQKIYEKMQSKYSSGLLIELNSQMLYSKWFSESGKMVTKAFEKIQKELDDPKALVFILIDEIESLASNRQEMTNANESTDSLRAVNALLTQLDHVKRNPNVFILTTSNITETLDPAFVDRADINQYVGSPSSEACYKIYRAVVQDMLRVGAVCPRVTLADSWNSPEGEKPTTKSSAEKKHSQHLKDLAKLSFGFSGRLIKRIPLLAYIDSEEEVVHLDDFWKKMKIIIKNQ